MSTRSTARCTSITCCRPRRGRRSPSTAGDRSHSARADTASPPSGSAIASTGGSWPPWRARANGGSPPACAWCRPWWWPAAWPRGARRRGSDGEHRGTSDGGRVSGLSLRLYHRLPSPARSLAASLHGWYLRWSRYGRDTPRLIAEAQEREHWIAAQWDTWRQERLAYVLHRAATRVPYYRAQWAARRRQGAHASWEVLENWPILDNERVRETPAAFIADDRNPRWMFNEHTSGTTGKPLVLWRTHQTMRSLHALAVARTRAWHGVSRGDRWAMLGGQLVVPTASRRPPFWVWNAALRQLYMSTYHLAPDLVPHYLDALRRYEIVYLLGYPSALYALAQEVLRLGRGDVTMRVAITSAEPLPEWERETIATAFGCPVRETYGMSETVAWASECERGTLHLWPEVGLIEVLA